MERNRGEDREKKRRIEIQEKMERKRGEEK